MLSVKGLKILNIPPTKVLQKKSRAVDLQYKPPLPKKKSIPDIRLEKTMIPKHDYVCDQRKQNQLNARFILKKRQLFEITRQNVRLFQKINSQKSVYSHQSLHKSYESNKSLINSRLTNRSKKSINKSSNKQLKRSQMSVNSKSSQNQKINSKNKFYNRAISAKSNYNPPRINKIIFRDVKRKSMIHLKPKSIQQTQPQDLKQFVGLFNIKQEPTGKQRNRPARIRSTKNFAYQRNRDQNSSFEQKTTNQSKQIVINQENEIEIHEQIEVEDQKTCRNISSRAKSQLSMNLLEQALPKILSQTIKQNAGEILQTLKNSKKSEASDCSISNKLSKENVQNLFDVRNSKIKNSIEKRLGNEKVVTKYSNLVIKINNQLNKHIKKSKQTTIYPYRSRLIA